MSVIDTQTAQRAPTTAQRMTEAAQGLLASLRPRQTNLLHLPFGDDRFVWDWLPGEPRPRKGVRLLHMTDEQQTHVMALIDAALSSRAARQANKTRQLEAILRQFEKSNPDIIFVVRDPEQYWVAVFGEPGGAEPWGWGITGHHVSIHMTVVDRDIVVPWPMFIGAQPSTIQHGPEAGFRNLPEEEDLARALLSSFSAEQKAVAILGQDVPWDVFTHNTPQPDRSALPTGLTYADMTGEQRSQLIGLVRHYAQRPAEDVAAIEWAKLERAGFDQISFGWLGSEERGKGHYYNIVGPTFMIEYDHVQNNATHMHSLWRDFTNDFAQDILAEHYASHHNA